MEFKGTKGDWFINQVGGIPIGVNAVIESSSQGTYSKNIVEIILPENDSEWDKEKAETTANLQLIITAQELLKSCQEMWHWIMRQEDWIGEDPKKEWKDSIIKALKQ